MGKTGSLFMLFYNGLSANLIAVKFLVTSEHFMPSATNEVWYSSRRPSMMKVDIFNKMPFFPVSLNIECPFLSRLKHLTEHE